MKRPIYLNQILSEHRRLQLEVKERNCALFDPEKEITIDEAITERKIIDHTEEELRLVEEKIIMQADLGFFGISHPGGLTPFFYGYHTTPGAPAAGNPTRDSG